MAAAEPLSILADHAGEGVLLCDAARLLRIPARATLTALVYLHRLRRQQRLELAAADLAVVLQPVVSVSNNHLANAVHVLEYLSHSVCCPIGGISALLERQSSNSVTISASANATAEIADSGAVIDTASLTMAVKNCTVLVGDRYYSFKEHLLHCEQVVLRAMRFQLLVDQPYAHLLNIARALKAPQPLIAVAVSVLHDALTLSEVLALDEAPLRLAVGALQLAAMLLGMVQVLPVSGDVTWCEAFDVRHADMEDTAHRVLDLVLAARQVLGPLKQQQR